MPEEDRPSEAGTPPSSRAPAQVSGRRQVLLWSILLSVYLGLFAATGYLAFFSADSVPGADRYHQIIRIEGEADKAFIKEIMQAEDDEHRKRKDLAMQAFNVVLGALLGFMSASATSMLDLSSKPEPEEL